MASRTVTRRQTTASAVEAAAATHAGEAAEVLAPLFAGVLPEGGPQVDLLLLQEGLAGVLRAHREALEGADSAHIEELRDDIGPRERRDEATARLHDGVAKVRGTVETLFGAGASARLFALKGLTSRNPEVLRRQAERMLTRLRDTTKPLPEPEVSWLAVDPEAWAAEIEPALAELVAALREVYADRRRAEITFRRKQQALERHNRTYEAVTSILGGLYRLSGLDVYEARLRPTVPQGTRPEDALPEEESPVEAPPSEGQPEPAPPVPFPAPVASGAGAVPANDDDAVTTQARNTA